jgi:hypothetical protein
MIMPFGRIALSILLAAASARPADQPTLQFDHVWIMVSPNAPERAALERAGFQIASQINHHEGQGTSSITVEFQNAFLELMWPDASVSVAPGLERAAEKFHQRMLWRTSGWSPIGIGLHRTGQGNDSLPFPTWSTSAPWMPAGSAIEMPTPRDDTTSPALFVVVYLDRCSRGARNAKCCLGRLKSSFEPQFAAVCE